MKRARPPETVSARNKGGKPLVIWQATMLIEADQTIIRGLWAIEMLHMTEDAKREQSVDAKIEKLYSSLLN